MSLERGYRQPCEDPLVEHLTCFPQDTLNAEQFGGNISDLFEPGKNASYWYGTNESLLECPDEGFVTPDCANVSNATDRPTRSINIWTLDRRLAPLGQELAGSMPVEQTQLSRILDGEKGFQFTLRARDPSKRT